MTNKAIRPATAAAINFLRADPDCMISLGTLLDELGDKAPRTAQGLLELIGDLINDPQIHQRVPGPGNETYSTLDFAWVRQE
jgi:hypothetical protein